MFEVEFQDNELTIHAKYNVTTHEDGSLEFSDGQVVTAEWRIPRDGQSDFVAEYYNGSLKLDESFWFHSSLSSKEGSENNILEAISQEWLEETYRNIYG